MKKLMAIALALILAGLADAAQATGPAAEPTSGPLVDVAWVKANLGTPGLVFLDLRGPLGGASRAHYL